LISLIVNQTAIGQEYGLEFLGHEVVIDKRTSLILGKEKSFCPNENTALEFDLKFKPKVSSYFGYVFRIIDDDNRNIDLLFQSDAKGKKQHFRIVSVGQDIKIGRELDSTALYSKWNHFKVLIQNNQLQFYCNNQLFGKGTLPFKFNRCFKIYAGECSNPKFLTSDALPMFLRNIILKSDEEIIHHWPLKEVFGNSSLDIIAQNQAVAKNPQWLLKDHYEWKLLKKIKFKGNSSFTFEEQTHQIIINSNLRSYFLNTNNDVFSSKDFVSQYPKFTFGDVSIYLKNQQKLINVRLNEQKIFNYNQAQNSWDISPNEQFNLTEYWHHNKFIYPNDTALAFIGGYGQFKYKNRVQKFSFNTQKWSDLTLKGDIIQPRYMFGMGSSNNTKSFIFGGFGSNSGDQGLSPQNYYDLFEIDWQTNTSKKIYQLTQPDIPFVVASSLIVNDNKKTFYGLIYNQLKLNSSLQLIEGSLINPSFTRISKEIPYKFMDVSSFADLYYDKENQKLFCVTSFFDRTPVDSTEISIYSLNFPPTNLAVYPQNQVQFNKANTQWWIAIFLGLTGLLIGIWYFRKKNVKQKEIVEIIQEDLKIESKKISESPKIIIQTESIKEEKNAETGKISLFGTFKVINSQDIDLTNQFSPLLKEMFLFILLNSIRWNKGIESSKLNEMFWYDKSTNSARNNRSVNITKLKSIFEQLSGIQINKDSGNWKIIFEPSQVNIDYFEIQNLTQSKKVLSNSQVKKLLAIINQGSFLSNLEYEWLDDFKGEISNKIIDVLLAYSEQLTVEDDAEKIVEIADNIFKFDSVDEKAMSLKCKSLIHLGKHSLAKSSYEKFAKDYQRLYSEEYTIQYKEFLDL
jgi:two-component SAPR family response regulator